MGRALGLVVGYAADQLLGDPRRFHPVAGFGSVAAALERRMNRSTGGRAVSGALAEVTSVETSDETVRSDMSGHVTKLVSTDARFASLLDQRCSGVLFVALLVGGAALAGKRLDRGTVPTALATYAVLGGRSLAREAQTVHAHLDRGDLDAAREQVTHLVGRDPSRLGPDEIARATIESVAENTSDAVVAPLFWGAVAGPVGLLGYRAANTLDAMVGHRTPRHEDFGWAAARFDDLLNIAPARLSAALATGLGGNPRDAWHAWHNDAHQHPSPNAGPVEAAFAGSLGIRLGGTNTYAGSTEDRGYLGSGKSPAPADIPRASQLAARVGWAALGVSAAIAGLRRRS